MPPKNKKARYGRGGFRAGNEREIKWGPEWQSVQSQTGQVGTENNFLYKGPADFSEGVDKRSLPVDNSDLEKKGFVIKSDGSVEHLGNRLKW